MHMGKRQNLASIQQSAVVAAKGYGSMGVRTGYEGVIASRCDDTMAFTAKQSGKVTKVNDRRIVVEYGDGSTDTQKLGVVHGVNAGDVVPHHIVTDLQIGTKVEPGDVLSWNDGFFERDLFSKGNVVLKTGVPATIALIEGNDVLEDGSAISERMSDLLTTSISKRKTLLVEFDKEVLNLVKVGDTVDYETVLCSIRDQSLNTLEQDDASIAALGRLASSSPKAKFAGKVTNVEVFYMGETSDMSESLQAIVKADSRRRAKDRKDEGPLTASTGQINEPTFVGGEKVIPNTVAISIYIDDELKSALGDKSVVANQLKTVHGRVMQGRNETEDGTPIDILFGWRSVMARIVLSVIMQGLGNRVMRKLSNDVLEAYRS